MLKLAPPPAVWFCVIFYLSIGLRFWFVWFPVYSENNACKNYDTTLRNAILPGVNMACYIRKHVVIVVINVTKKIKNVNKRVFYEKNKKRL